MLVIPGLTQTSYASAEDVVVTKAFIQSVKTNLPALYKKEYKALSKNEAKNLNALMSLDRKQLLHALAEVAGESQTSQKMVVDFFSRYLMKDYVLFLNELEPHPNSQIAKSVSAYKILLAVTTPKQQAVLEKELAENKNFGVRWIIYNLFVDKYGDSAVNIFVKFIPTEKNQDIRTQMIVFAFEAGDRNPELLRVIVQPYLEVGGSNAKNVYRNSIVLINLDQHEYREKIWAKYLIYNLDDPASAKLWKDLGWSAAGLRDIFKDDPVVMKRLVEMDPKILYEYDYVDEYDIYQG
ncbi:hypothetical protein [Paenibacillus sp. GCM10012306]|uniref:hypothetical protein n=1 Tax=Paenibacillus sp. GCM10012306 TaxID=3317342 RepID=UPI0036D3A422